jgi:adenine-specific DNA-methyltransferase
MSANLDKLKRLLAELFQLDQADLDFGIYRIMNAKREEITRFLDNDLLPQVQTAFLAYRGQDRAALEGQLQEAVQKAKDLGVEPETTRVVKELQEKLAAAVDVTALENEVFSDLYNFFRRYYNEGDFLSLRRYKEGVYAIPYEGEEVKLHWANADQYYIKTAEYFRDYAFKLPSGKRVHFKLAEADTERDNNQAPAGNDRRFILIETDPLLEQEGDFVIRFEYRPDAEGRKQKEIKDWTVEQILQAPGFAEWQAELAQLHPTEKNPKRTLLEKHLTDYTARNTFDYFIHKDLGGFLRRELDFFIKNEIMHLDDIEHESAPRVEQYLSKIKVIRAIAHKLIAFLAQIEDFQKQLWLKKKFVVETNYCVTLDRVPEELYPEIAANDAQREEWVRLFSIDEITGNLHTPKYSNPLKVEFFKANPYMVLDTKFFGQDFKDRLLASQEDIDDQIDGLLIHSENFQALNLLQERYREQIKCIYIDPPYNTGGDGFPYKDGYQHSSWFTMIYNRLIAAKKLMDISGLIASSIDDHEIYRLGLIFENIWGEKNRAACAPWRSEPSGGKEKTGLRTGHEYLLIYHNGNAKEISQEERSTGELNLKDRIGPYRKGRELRKWGGTSLRQDRQNQYYALIAPDGTEVYPIRNDGKEGHWRWGKDNENIKEALSNPDFFHWEKTSYDQGVSYKGGTDRWTPYEKIRDVKKSLGWSTWLDNFGINADATRTLKEMFGHKVFETPKPVQLVEWFCNLHGDDNGVAMDFYSGSGVLGHAVLEINRNSRENRKYILVDMGDFFDTVIKPRITKVIYSQSWKDGKPTTLNTGISHMFKYIRLESYEDTLNNLELKRTEAQQSLLAGC